MTSEGAAPATPQPSNLSLTAGLLRGTGRKKSQIVYVNGGITDVNFQVDLLR